MSLIKLATRGEILSKVLLKNKKNLFAYQQNVLDPKFGYKKVKNAIRQLFGNDERSGRNKKINSRKVKNFISKWNKK